ncbi:hypothetical protein NPIL_472941 [Nephila pilipes]|uniref:Uncharacterized protein n=1 Tax=Nephila pilipes TaxID=299642 RepID=A0A8X6UPL2_NEPPI|nr:hypothetical protein NPIL_472941 [Nephila pilipes]
MEVQLVLVQRLQGSRLLESSEAGFRWRQGQHGAGAGAGMGGLGDMMEQELTWQQLSWNKWLEVWRSAGWRRSRVPVQSWCRGEWYGGGAGYWYSHYFMTSYG